MTQLQFEDVCGENPAYFSPTGNGQYEVTGLDTENFPVELVSWQRSAEFCNRLSQLEGLEETYTWDGELGRARSASGYRLPTEAQWEFACRAGTASRYWFAETGEELSTYGWFGLSAGGRTHAVGQLRPNPFGLHDMLGNVAEWCQDGWDPLYYTQFKEQTAVDPAGPESNIFFRVVRGGSWRFPAINSRSAARNAGGPILKQVYIGLRVALPAESVKTLLKSPPKPPETSAPSSSPAPCGASGEPP